MSRPISTMMLLLVSVEILLGQTPTAQITGRVTDPSGSVIPGAQISTTNVDTGMRRQTSTNESGFYRISSLPPGNYRIIVQKDGFRPVTRTGITLLVEQVARIDVALELGQITESVTVTGGATIIDAVEASLGRVVETKSLQDMPLSSRSALDFVNLAPGVTQSMIPGRAVGGESATFTGTNFVSNGIRNAQADVLVDGLSVTVQEQNGGITDAKFRPSVEAVQEFKVQTNSFNAEYGFTAGTVVNMVTRSGTNEFHGSLYAFHNNNDLAANTFFANRSGSKLTPYRKNQFGGSMGGPVRIPRAYDGRNRTFFFLNHEGIKKSVQATMLTTVPTNLQRDGDFSETFDAAGRLLTVYDPFAVHLDAQTGRRVRDAFPGNVVPKSRLNPVAVKAVSYYPKPSSSGSKFTNTYNYFNAGSKATNGYQTTMKLDQNFSESSRLSGRYSRYRMTDFTDNLWTNSMSPQNDGGWMDFTNNVSLDFTRVLSPSALLNLRWGVARQFGTRTTYAEEEQFTLVDAGLPFDASFDTPLPPRFLPAGYETVGTSPWAKVTRGEDVNDFVGTLTKTTGVHTLKFGGEARMYRLNYGQPGVNYVTLQFGRNQTMRDPLTTNSLQGNSIASLFMGWGSTGSFSSRSPSSWASQSYSFFFQDDIQLTKRLSVNLGLRYEYDVPRTERFDRVVWFNPAAKSPISAPGYPDLRGGLEFADQNKRAPYDPDKDNLAPRFGFAYRITGKSVIRGGYGMYYGNSLGRIRSVLGPGYSADTSWNISLDSHFTQYASLSNPFPDGITEPPGSKQGLATFIGKAISGAPIREWNITPYYQQWSFSAQQQFPADSVLEIAYSGSHGVHLTYGSNTSLNSLDPLYYSLGDDLYKSVKNPFYGVITDPTSVLSKATVSQVYLLRPNPQFSTIGGEQGPPNANSIYHAGQVKFTKRYSHNLVASAHYTFSKLIDDSSDPGSARFLSASSGNIQHRGNLRLERSVSVLDITHQGVVDFSYELPVGRGHAIGRDWRRFADLLLGGWQINGIMTFRSGFPLVPTLAAGRLPDATQRPNLLYEPGLPGSVQDRLSLYLDANAFSQPVKDTYGTAPRTLSRVRAPGLRSMDASIHKLIYFGENKARHLQIRGEAFNLTNTPAFGFPGMSVGSTTFGVISSQSNGARQLQVALKLNF